MTEATRVGLHLPIEDLLDSLSLFRPHHFIHTFVLASLTVSLCRRHSTTRHKSLITNILFQRPHPKTLSHKMSDVSFKSSIASLRTTIPEGPLKPCASFPETQIAPISPPASVKKAVSEASEETSAVQVKGPVEDYQVNRGRWD